MRSVVIASLCEKMDMISPGDVHKEWHSFVLLGFFFVSQDEFCWTIQPLALERIAQKKIIEKIGVWGDGLFGTLSVFGLITCPHCGSEEVRNFLRTTAPTLELPLNVWRVHYNHGQSAFSFQHRRVHYLSSTSFATLLRCQRESKRLHQQLRLPKCKMWLTISMSARGMFLKYKSNLFYCSGIEVKFNAPVSGVITDSCDSSLVNQQVVGSVIGQGAKLENKATALNAKKQKRSRGKRGSMHDSGPSVTIFENRTNSSCTFISGA